VPVLKPPAAPWHLQNGMTFLGQLEVCGVIGGRGGIAGSVLPAIAWLECHVLPYNELAGQEGQGSLRKAFAAQNIVFILLNS
jgi:hypothetical protein